MTRFAQHQARRRISDRTFAVLALAAIAFSCAYFGWHIARALDAGVPPWPR